MRVFAAVLCCSLAMIAVNSAQGDERSSEDEPVVGDTLQSALDAVTRRRLQIVDNEPGYFGLNYRYPKEESDSMPFLSDDSGGNGASDSREIQEVKDKVMTRLAAAYNLEKMRRVLGEFQSSLSAQKMSKPNLDEQEDKRKRVAIKKERADDINVREKKSLKKRSDEEYNAELAGPFDHERNFGEIVEGPATEPVPEGYFGDHYNSRVVLDPHKCPILKNIAMKCTTRLANFKDPLLPVCALHQICYICGSQGDTQSPASCDNMFNRKSEQVCLGNAKCLAMAARTIRDLTGRMPLDVLYGMRTQCWESFCTDQIMNRNRDMLA